MSSLFVAPATLRDVPRADAAEAFPQDHPALIVPATDDSPAYEMSYTTLAAAITAVGKQLMPLLPAGKDEQVGIENGMGGQVGEAGEMTMRETKRLPLVQEQAGLDTWTAADREPS